MKHTNTTGLAEPTTRPQIPRHFFLALRVNTKLCDQVYQAGRVPDHRVRCAERIPPFQVPRAAAVEPVYLSGFKDDLLPCEARRRERACLWAFDFPRAARR